MDEVRIPGQRHVAGLVVARIGQVAASADPTMPWLVLDGAGAHEKGGVEGQIGWFRRNHLVPIPEVDSLDELNAMVDAWDEADDARRIVSPVPDERRQGTRRRRDPCRAIADRAPAPRPHPGRHSAAAERGEVRPAVGQPT